MKNQPPHITTSDAARMISETALAVSQEGDKYRKAVAEILRSVDTSAGKVINDTGIRHILNKHGIATK